MTQRARSLTERHQASNLADVGSNPAGRTIFNKEKFMNPNLKAAVYVRKGANIRNVESGENTNYPSINLAKIASRKLQARLGDGTVRRAI
jgi:hypothetical protein